MRISDAQRRHLLFLLSRDVSGATVPYATARTLLGRAWIKVRPGRPEGLFILTVAGRDKAKALKKEIIVKHPTRGFASMPPEKRREHAAKGGASVKPENRAFSTNSTLASRAGQKGGVAVPPEKRSFSKDNALASRAGKIGGKAKRT